LRLLQSGSFSLRSWSVVPLSRGPYRTSSIPQHRIEEPEPVEFHQVRYFLALCREQTFTRAAKACCVSQPSLTNAIKHLERELGGKLFHRARAESVLSELGHAVRPHLEKISQGIEEAHRAAMHLVRCRDSRPEPKPNPGGIHAQAATPRRRSRVYNSDRNVPDQVAHVDGRCPPAATDNLYWRVASLDRFDRASGSSRDGAVLTPLTQRTLRNDRAYLESPLETADSFFGPEVWRPQKSSSWSPWAWASGASLSISGCAHRSSAWERLSPGTCLLFLICSSKRYLIVRVPPAEGVLMRRMTTGRDAAPEGSA